MSAGVGECKRHSGYFRCALIFCEFILLGFVPTAEILLFRQKNPKPFPPVRGPTGPFVALPNQDGSETRYAQTVFPKESDSVRRRSRAQRGKRPEEIHRGGIKIPFALWGEG